MPAVDGILETAVYSNNVAVTVDFYRRVFGFEVLLDSPRLVALDVAGRNVLLIFQSGATRQSFTTSGGVIPGHGDGGPGHLAFAIEVDDVAAWREKLHQQCVEVESEVRWEQGALSLYFRDPDGNLVELMTRGFWKTY